MNMSTMSVIFILSLLLASPSLAQYEDSGEDGVSTRCRYQCTTVEAKKLLSSDPSMDTVKNVFRQLQRTFSGYEQGPKRRIISAGLLDELVRALSLPNLEIQQIAARAVRSLVQGGSTVEIQAAVDAKVLPAVVGLTRSDTDSILLSECILVIGFVGSRRVQFRDAAMEAGALTAARELAEHIYGQNPDVVRHLAWMCSKLCVFKDPQIPPGQVDLVLPIIQRLLLREDYGIRRDAVDALSSLTESPKASEYVLEAAFKLEMLPEVRHCLDTEIESIMVPALRVIDMFAKINANYTQAVLDTDILGTLYEFLDGYNSVVKRRTCSLLASIIAKSPGHIQALIDKRLLQKVIYILRRDSQVLNTPMVLAAFCKSASPEQIYSMVRNNLLDAAGIEMRSDNEIEVDKDLLTIVEAAFNATSIVNPDALQQYKRQFKETRGYGYLKHPPNDHIQQIVETSKRIFDKYFKDDEL